MLQYMRIHKFAQGLFDETAEAKKGAEILRGILAARSPRLSEIAHQMRGKVERNYKTIQRFIQQVDTQSALLRLFQADAPFVIGDPTEMPRPNAKHTAYVGTLSDGETRGYWMLVLATPFRGRAIPFHFLTYSSKTIADQSQSRNLYHHRAFGNIKEFLGEKPLVVDREFSYGELLQNLVAEGVHFVIRLNEGSHPPTFTDVAGRKVPLKVAPGKTTIHQRVLYKGEVEVNLIGYWRVGLRDPMWVLSDLDPREARSIYEARMKIEESFRDLKSLLHMDKAMNRQQHYLERMLALVMLAYGIGVMLGEETRDEVFSQPANTASPQTASIPDRPNLVPTPKWKIYSGLFLLLKRRLTLSPVQIRRIFQRALALFRSLLFPPVRSFV